MKPILISNQDITLQLYLCLYNNMDRTLDSVIFLELQTWHLTFLSLCVVVVSQVFIMHKSTGQKVA